MSTHPPDRVAKGTNYRAHFTHHRNGYPSVPQRVTNQYRNLGFRTFRPARTVTRETPPP